ncbi:MAG: Uma2 family endonuclease [Saprospiraceae bacterium]|jgi:Uma2 family endonuclease|nr:Uma2 family endonuclease [Saprospiraceae bacterium]
MTAKAQSIGEKHTSTSLDDYFAFEAQAEGRHEFVAGKIEAMAYTSPEHGQIASNLALLLGACARERGCSVFIGDRMLFVPDCNSVFYPDLLILCGEHEFHQSSKNMKATLNPSVVIEILSDSTEYLDKTAKTRCYKKIPSLKQIVFVSQKERHIRILEREGERWIDTEFYEENDLPHIGDCAIPLEEAYWKVEV